jgi:hypothetical protein
MSLLTSCQQRLNKRLWRADVKFARHFFIGTTPTQSWDTPVFSKGFMMQTHFEEISTRLFSPKLWRGFPAPTNMNPTGSSYQGPSGNPVFGFFDDFFSFHAATLDGPYLTLVTDGGIVINQIADTDERKGIVAIDSDATGANDEGVIQWGRGRCAPFKLANNDLCFEACLSVDVITADDYSIAIGLAEAADGASAGLFAAAANNVCALADTNFLGFVKLTPETSDWDGAYKANGQTYQDGATKTKLNAVAKFTASGTTYKKLGFRYRAVPKSLEWYVDGNLAGTSSAPARLTASEIDAATFPDSVFLAPIIGLKVAVAASVAIQINMDWWACAQME